MARDGQYRTGAIGLNSRRTQLIRWWRCHRQLASIARRLELAGVARNDPVYPLIIEIGLVPIRMGRLLAIYIGSTALALVVVAWIVAPRYPVTEISGSNGQRILVITTPAGARWVTCPLPAEQVCLEVNAPPSPGTSSIFSIQRSHP